MDESFELFFGNLGPAFDRREIDPSPYRGRLPEKLLEYWAEHGLCGYADGSFWTVDPAEYTDVLGQWLEGTPLTDQTYHVVARTAFGQLYAWGERTLRPLAVTVEHAIVVPGLPPEYGAGLAVEAFFASFERRHCDSSDDDGRPLFDRALKQLGRVAYDEMYGFVPALALGGPKIAANLRRVKIREHLELLSSLEPLRVIDFTPGTGAPRA